MKKIKKLGCLRVSTSFQTDSGVVDLWFESKQKPQICERNLKAEQTAAVCEQFEKQFYNLSQQHTVYIDVNPFVNY